MTCSEDNTEADGNMLMMMMMIMVMMMVMMLTTILGWDNDVPGEWIPAAIQLYMTIVRATDDDDGGGAGGGDDDGDDDDGGGDDDDDDSSMVTMFPVNGCQLQYNCTWP